MKTQKPSDEAMEAAPNIVRTSLGTDDHGNEYWRNATPTEIAARLDAFAAARVAEERRRLFVIREARKCVHENPHEYWLNLADDVLDNEMGPFATEADALRARGGR